MTRKENHDRGGPEIQDARGGFSGPPGCRLGSADGGIESRQHARGDAQGGEEGDDPVADGLAEDALATPAAGGDVEAGVGREEGEAAQAPEAQREEDVFEQGDLREATDLDEGAAGGEQALIAVGDPEDPGAEVGRGVDEAEG